MLNRSLHVYSALNSLKYPPQYELQTLDLNTFPNSYFPPLYFPSHSLFPPQLPFPSHFSNQFSFWANAKRILLVALQ